MSGLRNDVRAAERAVLKAVLDLLLADADGCDAQRLERAIRYEGAAYVRALWKARGRIRPPTPKKRKATAPKLRALAGGRL